ASGRNSTPCPSRWTGKRPGHPRTTSGSGADAMAYSKFERHTWHDERFRGWKRDVRDMWKYILTSPHTNRLGCFVLDPMYAAADLSAADDRWSEARAEAAIRELEQTGRIRYDWSTRLLLIV